MVKKTLTMTTVLLLLTFSFSFAQHGHMEGDKQQPQPMMHGQMGGDKQQAQPMKMPSIDVLADGIEATFMVMKNESHINMLKGMKMEEDIEPASTHNIMILLKDEKTGKEFNNIPVMIKVIDADDNEQVKTGSFKEMMRTYDAYFNMRKGGKYRIKILFETQGQKRSVGVSHDMS